MQSVIDYAPKLFDMPQAAKDSLSMLNNESFFGYNKLGAEITKGATDFREQVNPWRLVAGPILIFGLFEV